MSAQKEINLICNSINRRIMTMDYRIETEIRDYLLQQADNDKLLLCEYDSNRIADMLDVNTTCIYDLLTDLDYNL